MRPEESSYTLKNLNTAYDSLKVVFGILRSLVMRRRVKYSNQWKSVLPTVSFKVSKLVLLQLRDMPVGGSRKVILVHSILSGFKVSKVHMGLMMKNGSIKVSRYE